MVTPHENTRPRNDTSANERASRPTRRAQSYMVGQPRLRKKSLDQFVPVLHRRPGSRSCLTRFCGRPSQSSPGRHSSPGHAGLSQSNTTPDGYQHQQTWKPVKRACLICVTSGTRTHHHVWKPRSPERGRTSCRKRTGRSINPRSVSQSTRASAHAPIVGNRRGRPGKPLNVPHAQHIPVPGSRRIGVARAGITGIFPRASDPGVWHAQTSSTAGPTNDYPTRPLR